MPVHLVYRLTVNDMSPNGLTNTSGVLLDANGDGNPGGNYVADLRGFGLDKPHVPFNKFIREQLGGKPVSSRRMSHPSSKSLLQHNHPKSVFQTPAALPDRIDATWPVTWAPDTATPERRFVRRRPATASTTPSVRFCPFRGVKRRKTDRRFRLRLQLLSCSVLRAL